MPRTTYTELLDHSLGQTHRQSRLLNPCSLSWITVVHSLRLKKHSASVNLTSLISPTKRASGRSIINGQSPRSRLLDVSLEWLSRCAISDLDRAYRFHRRAYSVSRRRQHRDGSRRGETTRIDRPPRGREEVPVQLSRLFLTGNLRPNLALTNVRVLSYS